MNTAAAENATVHDVTWANLQLLLRSLASVRRGVANFRGVTLRRRTG